MATRHPGILSLSGKMPEASEATQAESKPTVHFQANRFRLFLVD